MLKRLKNLLSVCQKMMRPLELAVAYGMGDKRLLECWPIRGRLFLILRKLKKEEHDEHEDVSKTTN